MASNEPAVIRDLSQHPGVVALVGFSLKPNRPSKDVAEYLVAHGVTVYPVNPMFAGQQGLGKTIVATLAEVPEHIHIVDIFRRAEDVPSVIDEAIAVKADAVWLQLGITNPEAERVAEDAGLLVVSDLCLKVEHARYAQRG